MDQSSQTSTLAPAADSSPPGTTARPAGLAVALVALGAALGAAGGWLWYRWWGPPGKGEVFETTAGPLWFDVSDQAMTSVFDATAQYVVVGVALGLVLGLAGGLLGARWPLVALGALVVASAAGAAVAAAVGFQLSPPDPQSLADEVEIGTRLPDGLVLDGWTPYLSWPIGALFGFLVVTLSTSGLAGVRRRERDHTTWLERQPRG